MMTAKQKLFCIEYMVDLNGAAAARRAGYSASTARQKAHGLLQDSEVKAEIARLMEDKAMSAEEAVYRMTQMARGSLAPFLRYTEYKQLDADGKQKVDDKGKPLPPTISVSIDLTTEEARANLHLLKELKSTEWGYELKIHDPKDAVDKVIQLHGKYKQLPGDAGGDKNTTNIYVLPDGSKIEF